MTGKSRISMKNWNGELLFAEAPQIATLRFSFSIQNSAAFDINTRSVYYSKVLYVKLSLMFRSIKYYFWILLLLSHKNCLDDLEKTSVKYFRPTYQRRFCSKTTFRLWNFDIIIFRPIHRFIIWLIQLYQDNILLQYCPLKI